MSLPGKHVKSTTERLPIGLDPRVGAVYVHDEGYWKRCCLGEGEDYNDERTITSNNGLGGGEEPKSRGIGRSRCKILAHGLTWKQLYFETHLQSRLENFDPSVESLDSLIEEVKTYQDYVFTLHFEQLPSHIEIHRVCSILKNLCRLEICYGINRIGMRYDRMLFGMKISDASSLANSIKDSGSGGGGMGCLTSVILANNLIDDDLLRMLMTGLYKSTTVTHLDVSHNKITNHGVRLLAKLLGTKSVLTSLNVADNQIHAEGGRYLGRALRSNDSLSDLNLRLNRLTDEGGRMLLEGLRDNVSVTRLNLSSNSLGSESTTALSVVLREPENPLSILDLSSNNLSDDDLEILNGTLNRNDKLVCLDLRMNNFSTSQGGDEVLEGLAKIEEILQRNELKYRG